MKRSWALKAVLMADPSWQRYLEYWRWFGECSPKHGGMGLEGMGVPSQGDGFLGLNRVCSPLSLPQPALPCASAPEEDTSMPSRLCVR